jgi:glyoxylase-like metal-dependent hydrolase (beta-lactamase superfamily II)
MDADALSCGPLGEICCLPIAGQKTGLIGYLLLSHREGEAVAVDPPSGETELILALTAEHGVRLTQVLRTHVHEPDMDDPVLLCRRSGARLAVGRGAAKAGRDLRADAAVGAGMVLRWGVQYMHVLETPGHTSACVSYLWRDRLFCGDVFDLGGQAGAGKAAEPARLFDSLTRCLFSLPEQTLVYPAHPIKGRRVALLGELRQRYAPILAAGRETFITERSDTGLRASFVRLPHGAG